MWLTLARRIDALNAAVGRLVGGLLAVMVLVGAYNAIARTVQKDAGVLLTSNGLLELQWYLFGCVFLLGAAHTLRRDEHVRVDVLYGGLPVRGRAWLDLVGGLVLLIPFCVFGCVASWSFVADSIADREWSNDPGGLPRWPLKPVIPIGFALLGLQGVSEVIKRIAVLRGHAPKAVGLGAEGDHAR